MSAATPFVFFGTPEFAVSILDELEAAGFLPGLVITAPDKPQGRHLALTPPPVKTWAAKRGIETWQPTTLRTREFQNDLAAKGGWEFFVVAAYGKIIPQETLDIPRGKVLNVHPSLLPKLRGASPVQSAILEEDGTGVTIMRLDAEMDHGPIVAQKQVDVPNWPPKHSELEKLLAQEGGKLLAGTIPDWLAGNIAEVPQDHAQATYCKKIAKEDGHIDLSGDPAMNYRKIQAYAGWPGAYYFIENGGKKIRIKIVDAELSNGELILKRIVPEGKREMDYADFMRNL